jgi:hypothetical protein
MSQAGSTPARVPQQMGTCGTLGPHQSVLALPRGEEAQTISKSTKLWPLSRPSM